MLQTFDALILIGHLVLLENFDERLQDHYLLIEVLGQKPVEE